MGIAGEVGVGGGVVVGDGGGGGGGGVGVITGHRVAGMHTHTGASHGDSQVDTEMLSLPASSNQLTASLGLSLGRLWPELIRMYTNNNSLTVINCSVHVKHVN